MFNLVLNNEYISNIPLEYNPLFKSSDEAKRYILAFENIFEKFPNTNQTISFNDDIWDFNKCFYNSNTENRKILFTNLPEDIKIYLKFWVLYKIKEKIKISTIKRRIEDVKRLLVALFDKKGYTSLFLLTNKDIIEEIEIHNSSPQTQYGYYEAIYQFICFLKFEYKINLLVDIKTLDNIRVETLKLTKQVKHNRKIPDIPNEFFNKILFVSIKNMRDETIKYNRRATACLLTILTQTGLRIEDLLELEVDQLHKKTLSHINKTTYFIHYKAKKPSSKEDKPLEFDIFSNELCTEAFKTLTAIRKQCLFSKENNFLYILNHVQNSKDIFPVRKLRFKREYRRLLYDELKEECLKNWEGIKPIGHIDYTNSEPTFVKASFPTSQQYRVHICTNLYEKNIPLVYIQKYMGHLSEQMMGYYVRPKDCYQENIQYSEKIINEIVGDDITPLGGSFGKQLKENLQRFVKENNFNIKTDIHEIVKAFGDNVIIRGKTGGVCIKTSIVPCAKDNKTNQIYCAYNLCPNLFHFYYMVDVSYLDFRTLQETYKTMKKNKKNKAAQKELNKLKDLCRRRLLPELDELDFEINRKGKDIIIEKYPTLRDIIIDRENIRNEVKLWMSKK